MTTINFYILSPQKKLIPFVCQLAQTILQKSDDKLTIFAPTSLIAPLDELLWSFDGTSFIPHQVIIDADALSKQVGICLIDDATLLSKCTGIVINLTTEPLTSVLSSSATQDNRIVPTPATSSTAITKLLEIITADDISLIHGRQKYRHYSETHPQLSIQTFHIN